jgi:hypothetical protein
MRNPSRVSVLHFSSDACSHRGGIVLRHPSHDWLLHANCSARACSRRSAVHRGASHDGRGRVSGGHVRHAIARRHRPPRRGPSSQPSSSGCRARPGTHACNDNGRRGKFEFLGVPPVTFSIEAMPPWPFMSVDGERTVERRMRRARTSSGGYQVSFTREPNPGEDSDSATSIQPNASACERMPAIATGSPPPSSCAVWRRTGCTVP